MNTRLRHARRFLVLLVMLFPVLSRGEDWQRDKRDLLTHFANMYNPCVVETGGEHRFRMWFFGWAVGPSATPAYQIGAATPSFAPAQRT